VDVEKMKKVNSWTKYNREYVEKVYKEYGTAETYFRKASAVYSLKDITVPTLIVHSKDDPVVRVKCLPLKECMANPNIIVSLLKSGGHVCYFSGVTSIKRWYPKITADFFESIIERKESLKEYEK